LPHRIAYSSALGELGLVSHPVRTVFVAATKQVRRPTIGKRPLQVVIERPATIHLEAEQVGLSWRSTLERALFECALRTDLVGGIEQLAEALVQSADEANPAKIRELGRAFGDKGAAAERRLASLARELELPLSLEPKLSEGRGVIALDPRDHRVDWIDDHFRVAWNLSADEVRAVTGS
jgi:predicted transcriptional regulator of viral defense system